VCRSWRAAVADPAFVRSHLALARSRSPLTLLVISREHDPDDGASQPEDDVCFHRLALDEARTAAHVELMFKKALPTGTAGAVVPTHCDGLVALATANGRVCVCNPATGEFVALPPGARGSKGAAALCYDLWRHRYVVVRCFSRRYNEYKDAASGKRKLDYEIGHEVFTLGDSSSSWEPTADPPLAIGPADPVCTRDAVYWCTDDDDTLLRFSLRDRAFDVASGPPGAGSCCGNRTVTGLGGKLCYVACNRCTEGGYDVWVADADGRRLEWSLRCHVGIDQFGRPGVGEDRDESTHARHCHDAGCDYTATVAGLLPPSHTHTTLNWSARQDTRLELKHREEANKKKKFTCRSTTEVVVLCRCAHAYACLKPLACLKTVWHGRPI
jgi:F-box interacting protein